MSGLDSNAAEPPARPAVSATLATRLTSEFRVSFVDKPLRDAVIAIADAGKVNIWVDRHVDPTRLISTDADAHTIYLALASVAKSAGIEIHAVENLVLIGHRDWLERTVAAVRELPPLGQSQTISWPDLTTPQLAFAACGVDDDLHLQATTSLPHDLWPATRWDGIHANVGRLLVASQFNLCISRVDGSLSPLPTPSRTTALYPSGKQATAIRSAIKAWDPRSTTKEVNGQLLIAASPAAHLAATDAWLRTPSTTASKAFDVDQVRFTLRLQNAIADQVLRQLATTAGRNLIIDEAVAEACKRPVSISVQNETMRKLTQQIADELNVLVSWTDSELRVNKLP